MLRIRAERDFERQIGFNGADGWSREIWLRTYATWRPLESVTIFGGIDCGASNPAQLEEADSREASITPFSSLRSFMLADGIFPRLETMPAIRPHTFHKLNFLANVTHPSLLRQLVSQHAESLEAVKVLWCNGLGSAPLDPIDDLLPTVRKLKELVMIRANIHLASTVGLPAGVARVAAKMPDCTPDIVLRLAEGRGPTEGGSLQSLDIIDIVNGDVSEWKTVAAVVAGNGIKFKAGGREYHDPKTKSHKYGWQISGN
jgi:hypothetical protein